MKALVRWSRRLAWVVSRRGSWSSGWLGACGVAALLAWPCVASASEMLCAQMVERGYHQPAADCYEKEAKKILYRVDMKEDARLRKGGFLREAARNLDRAAAKKPPKVAAALREKAVALLDRILKLGLVRRKAGKRRGRLIKIMRSKILTKIGYTPLAISTASDDARIEVTGHQYKRTAKGKLNQSLRPGPYTVRVKYANESVWREKKVVLNAGSPAVLTFVKSPPVPPLAWVGYSVGSAAIIAGAAVLIYGITFFVADSDCKDPQTCRYVPVSGGGYEPCHKAGLLQGNSCSFPLRNLHGREGAAYYQGQGTLWSVLGGGIAVAGIALFSVALVAHVRSRKGDHKRKTSVKSTGLMPSPTKQRPTHARQAPAVQSARGDGMIFLTEAL